MLDVMKNPPQVIEHITWTASRVQMPDDGKPVLMLCIEDEEDPVWEGWWDSASDRWLNTEGYPVGMVTWWADKPAGPTEPSPGQPAQQGAEVAATMDHAVNMVFGSDGMPSQVKKHHLNWIVRTLLKQLGLAALGGRTLSIDLGNGHALQVQVRAIAEAEAGG